MFSIKRNSSKISMVYLVLAYLKEGGFKYIDTQFYSEHLKQFGTKKIEKKNIWKSYRNTVVDTVFPEEIRKNVLEYFK